MPKQCPHCKQIIDHLVITYWQSEWNKHRCVSIEEDGEIDMDYDEDEVIDCGDGGDTDNYEYFCPLCDKEITGSQCLDTLWEMLGKVNTKKKDFINNFASKDA